MTAAMSPPSIPFIDILILLGDRHRPMGWPRLPRILMTDTVSVVLNAWGRDGEGGRAVASAARTDGIRAAVQPGDPARLPEQMRVAGVTPYAVDFAADVGLKVDDLILWTDPDANDREILVTGYAPLGGGSGTWQARGIEKT